ncbi:MAG: tetraacyldisaccharide 4'-kinase [Algicola sp.]|nr:tetraacyldisaccharide 4'-kinase [Algicola sp.]
MKLLRKILFPFVPIYYIVVWVRNRLYDMGWKSSKSYDLPIICVGNLSVGGTGKTPTIEYLISFLKEAHLVATLSRGYKRETEGFIIADPSSTAKDIGDEPLQFYRKFNHIIVSVDANRQRGISQLKALKQPDVILLDDAFQHRKVKAGFNILLTTYNQLYVDDMVLPTGNLREPKSGAKRATIILVTKCPENLTEADKAQVKLKLKPLSHQSVYFSTISYSDRVFSSETSQPMTYLKDKSITLVTGIANPQPLLDYLVECQITFEHLNFKDHHTFSTADIALLSQKPYILTTEKDYVRLKDEPKLDASELFYLPMSFEIDEEATFKKQIATFIESF